MSETQTGSVLVGSSTRPIKRFHKVAGDSGDNQLIAAVVDKRFRLLSLAIIATSTTPVSCYLVNGDNALLGTSQAKLALDLSGVDGSAGMILGENRFGWCETDAVNEALEINLSAAANVICIGSYIEID